MKKTENASSAFYTYIAPNYDKFVKPIEQYLSGSYTDDNGRESIIQNAICKYLAENISKCIPSVEQLKQLIRKNTDALLNKDLTPAELAKKLTTHGRKVKTYMRLHYSIEFINENSYGLEQAGYLMAIYSKVMSLDMLPNGNRGHVDRAQKIDELKNSAIYEYLYRAMLEIETPLTLNKLTFESMNQLTKSLYNSIELTNYKRSFISKHDAKYENIINKVLTSNSNTQEVLNKLFSMFDKKFNARLSNEVKTQEINKTLQN